MKISEELKGVQTIGISGHIRPDGDCVGSCMALYMYLKKEFPKAVVEVFLEQPPEAFGCIKDIEEIHTDFKTKVEKFDVFIALDTVKERMGEAEEFFDNAVKTINIDHHISNKGCGSVNYIDANASSTSELVYKVLDEEKIDAEIAKSIYIGIIHDTGVFNYSNTTPDALMIAAKLISFKFDFSEIIEKTFYEKSYVQTLLLGRALLESIVFMDGKCIVSVIHQKTLDFYHADSKDLEGIVSQLNHTKDAECTIFMYQTGVMEYKVSLRSKGLVNVAEIAVFFGGGGHVRAAGCTMNGTFHDVVNNLSLHIEKQLQNNVK
ncbi:MAG: bifunctional oligoribonuclease/PAP phosphatase NrnA [Clostridiales bacterium]|nr:bifunctional oligoribonuclease/PAP phosphatase NrnA [Clostridiales bacterium]